MQNFETIKQSIVDSSLSGDEKMQLTGLFADVPDELLSEVAALLKKDPSWVTKLNDNKKKKEEAFSTGNMDLWNEIMAEEKKYMSDMTFDLD